MARQTLGWIWSGVCDAEGMTVRSISEAKAELSALIEEVRKGVATRHAEECATHPL